MKEKTRRESLAVFNGMFCTKYSVFKLHIKNVLRFVRQYIGISYFICKNLLKVVKMNGSD